jgi:hypothetical protein
MAVAVLVASPAHAQTDPLAGIPVQARERHGGYHRELFGQGWPEDGHGCDVRDDILRRDMSVTSTENAPKCALAVRNGTLVDPYTGASIPFTRGPGTSKDVQIDHVVPLAYAWDMGAYQWPESQRATFYTDPQELLAVSGEANDAKGDKPPGQWLPPNQAYQCTYVQKFDTVLRDYHLAIDPASARVVQQLGCP